MTQEQKNSPVEVFQELLHHTNEEEMLTIRIINGDKTWAYGYEAVTKPLLSQCVGRSSPRPEKATEVKRQSEVQSSPRIPTKGTHQSTAWAGSGQCTLLPRPG